MALYLLIEVVYFTHCTLMQTKQLPIGKVKLQSLVHDAKTPTKESLIAEIIIHLSVPLGQYSAICTFDALDYILNVTQFRKISLNVTLKYTELHNLL